MRKISRMTLLTLIVAVPCLLSGFARPESEEAPGGREPTAPMEVPSGESSPDSEADPADLLRNGLMPFEGILVGGQPTTEQLATMKDLGYKTMINMRRVDEEGSTNPGDVEELGMTYIAIPIDGAAGVTEENARLLATTLKEAEHPVVIHCASGNRVGAIFAMKAFLVDGKSAEESLAIGKAAGVTRLEPVLREKLGLEEPAD